MFELDEASELVEHIPADLVDQATVTARFFSRLFVGGVTAILVPVAIAIAVLPFRDQSGLLQLSVLVVASLVGCLAWASAVYATGRAAACSWSPANLPTVELVRKDIKVVWYGELIQAKIADCHFRLGDASQMKYASRKARRLLSLCERDLILIDMPPLYRDMFGCTRSYTTVAVGCTDESFGQWNDALGLENRLNQRLQQRNSNQ